MFWIPGVWYVIARYVISQWIEQCLYNVLCCLILQHHGCLCPMNPEANKNNLRKSMHWGLLHRGIIRIVIGAANWFCLKCWDDGSQDRMKTQPWRNIVWLEKVYNVAHLWKARLCAWHTQRHIKPLDLLNLSRLGSQTAFIIPAKSMGKLRKEGAIKSIYGPRRAYRILKILCYTGSVFCRPL